jgi:steroid delta-isomerase-like uncharacterized protein
MSEQENSNVVQASFDAFTAHDLEQLSQWWAADFLAEQTGEPVPFNAEQHRVFLQGYLTAIPDAHIEVTLLIAQGNYVVVHWTGTGTQTGPLHTPTGRSIPATGKQVVLKVSETYELKGGKITHLWGFFDRVSLLSQLGVMPPM